MRHRNDTGVPQVVATDPPQLVEPGKTIDLDEHVAGLTCLNKTCPPPDEADEPVGDEPRGKTKKDRDAPAAGDGEKEQDR